ncbi:RNA polymerase sigma-54 factor RpoN [Alloactinosynnema sp. L-07]|uniref:RNA polymerase factor sigma-54 n=1 Tax=Alloactinosynnema sp. L-07 TaxID=1653480 RepID=UPI00065F0B33|nr:helix-turn-helix domain-containing protein [Alloactinosynnema sp. L-07]CRK59238.1 RNA polymerase sigma-54 factor RpoN [Alloactinosynnema sp. L-07]
MDVFTARQPALRMDLRARMEFRVGPAQLLLSELLPLPVCDLQVRLDAEVAANPALEIGDPDTCPGCGHPIWRRHCLRCVDPAHPAPLDTVGTCTTPRDQMLRDCAAALPAAGRRIAAYLVADVDDYGVLDESPQAIAHRLGVSAEDVLAAIGTLRRAGFAGMCARDLVESIQLQAVATGEELGMPQMLHELLARGLAELAEGRQTPIRFRPALAWLRVNMVPAVFEQAEVAPVDPVDIVVHRNHGQLHTTVIPGPWSAARVADSYRAVGDHPAVRGELIRASRFIEALDKREHSLLMVSQAVVTHQSARVIHGPAEHRKLTRRQIAAEVGLHESTVSRVVAGKRVSIPSGETVALASLFGAPSDLHDCIREVIDHEAAPLSDADVAIALAQRGHRAARRTVAKYRAELGIPDQYHRRHDAHPVREHVLS